MLFTYLSTYFSTKLHPRESIIVFDEIEFCPAARAAVKYLVEDGRYDYLETGSLLGMKMSTKKKRKKKEKKYEELAPSIRQVSIQRITIFIPPLVARMFFPLFFTALGRFIKHRVYGH